MSDTFKELITNLWENYWHIKTKIMVFGMKLSAADTTQDGVAGYLMSSQQWFFFFNFTFHKYFQTKVLRFAFRWQAERIMSFWLIRPKARLHNFWNLDLEHITKLVKLNFTICKVRLIHLCPVIVSETYQALEIHLTHAALKF